MRLSGKAALIVGAVVFLVGGWFGQVIEPDPPPEYKTTVVHDTDTVTETETVTEYIDNPACTEAAMLAKEIGKAAAEIDLITPQLLDIMSQLRIAVAMGDSHAANELETRLRRLDATIIDSSEVLATKREDLASAQKECNS